MWTRSISSLLLAVAAAAAIADVPGAAGMGVPAAPSLRPMVAAKVDVVRALPSAVIDPGFAWYSGRSAESLAEELKAKGFRSVRCILTNPLTARAGLVHALHGAGLPVVAVVFGNGVYDTSGLPPGWPDWKMRLRKGSSAEGFTYLCLNNPAYRAFLQDQIVSAVKRAGFDAVEIAESFWPAWGGPEADAYGCLCDRCRERFLKETGQQPPEFTDPSSSRYWKKTPELYRMWTDARVRWAVDFLNDLVNGGGGIRKRCGGVKVLVWGIASRGHSPEQMREWEGVDGALAASRVRPDGYVVQTDWPDWTQSDLPAAYVKTYAPCIQAVKKACPDLPVLIQTDLGSQKQMRRSVLWMRQCDAAARQTGAEGVFGYMMSLGGDVYRAPLRLLQVRDMGGTVRLVLNKWPDAGIETLSGWKAEGAEIDSVRRDGCTVVVRLSGRKPGAKVDLSWPRVKDDPSKRLFDDLPACSWAGPARVILSAGQGLKERYR